MRIAYLDAFSGISGDMTVGAFLSLGLPLGALRDAVSSLGLDGVELSSERVQRSGIEATQFRMRVHGRVPDAPHGHDDHRHGHHAEHPHRPYREVRALLERSPLAAPVKERALAVFAALARAEGAVHATAPEDVTFHEAGAVDAIVDVVGAALGFVHLGVETAYASPIPMGQGMVRAAHGPLPMPGPAAVELLRDRPVRFEDGAAELVTPTGAAIVAALTQPASVPPLRIAAAGYGAGTRVLADRPNLLRVVIGEAVVAAKDEDVVVIEATIDDMSPQLYEHVIDRLLEAGARDVFLVPAIMKKSRPATLLRVLAAPADRERLAAMVLAETSTIGLRWATWSRLALPREERTVETDHGPVRVKIARAPDGTVNVAPEFEDCRRLARERGVPLKTIWRAALVAASRV